MSPICPASRRGGHCRVPDHHPIINIILYIIFRTGLNLKMADPSLTSVQMCAAILVTMYGMYFANEARGVLLLIYI